MFFAQNRANVKPTTEEEIVIRELPNGCAVNTELHPTWYESNKYGTDNFGLDFRPNGACLKANSVGGFGYYFLTTSCVIWTNDGFWDELNAKELHRNGNWFVDWKGSGTPIPYVTKNSALGVRVCKDYFGYPFPDGTKFHNVYVDGDGNTYDGVIIGNLIWATENLKTTKFQNGNSIELAETPSDFETNISTPLYSFYDYNTIGDSHRESYGGLYNWYCIENGLVGDGWRVCTPNDLSYLRNYLINTEWDKVEITSSNVAQYIKSCRQVNHPLTIEECVTMSEGCAIATNEHPRWDENINHFGNNIFGFGGLPCGTLNNAQKFSLVGVRGNWWCSSDEGSVGDFFFIDETHWELSVYSKKAGIGVRCVKDYIGEEENGAIFYADYKDGDDNYYDSVVIGNQLWTIENLYTTRYQNGSTIPKVENTNDWGSLTTGAYCWYNNDYDEYGQYYGSLYNWYAVDNGLVDYNGYRVPSKEDWEQLIEYLTTTNWCDGVEVTSSNAAQFLKSCRQVNHPIPLNYNTRIYSWRDSETPLFKINNTTYYNRGIYFEAESWHSNNLYHQYNSGYTMNYEFNSGDIIELLNENQMLFINGVLKIDTEFYDDELENSYKYQLQEEDIENINVEITWYVV